MLIYMLMFRYAGQYFAMLSRTQFITHGQIKKKMFVFSSDFAQNLEQLYEHPQYTFYSSNKKKEIDYNYM